MLEIESVFNSIKVFTGTYGYLKKAQEGRGEVAQLKMEWAQEFLKKLKVEVKIMGKISQRPALLYVGNHISYLDILLLMSYVYKISFVAKSELERWPIIGPAAQKAETVFVKRENAESRMQARLKIQQGLQEGKRIAIFPSGTTCMYETKPWRQGPFVIAKEIDCWVQPFRLTYRPLRTAAYIDRDFFPVHLYNLFKQVSVQAFIEFHPPVKIKGDVGKQCEKWAEWSRQNQWLQS